MAKQIGAKVKVKLASGEWYFGTVTQAIPRYIPSGETRYQVKGDKPRPFETITSARSLKAA